ncbi:dTMP kinase [Aliidiomarina iranensis]|uniref:Thymidylate kinase n=1 Tax=Aliidiomarina iranensis TaxID=1434071 RepID=A0A432W011_9GAMM|nr:dTMP kinase [Aliidiomarina iranensis]RUO22346.1 dTMP kinase [Aliidiomarina iranensis]
MLGKFIVIEGLEGAGKSTAVATVSQWLEAHNIPFIQVREPGGTPFAEALRDIVKGDWQEQVTPQAELLLMYAARVQLVENQIKPALAAGTWVIGDRHDLSSRAYQGGGRGVDSGVLQQLKAFTLQDFAPDFTLYLDISPAVGLARASSRGSLDRFERSKAEFFTRTRNRYLEIAAQEPSIVVINAEQDLPLVQADIQQALEQQWPE